MFASMLRLFAVRPILGAVILGFPVLLLVIVGLVAIFALKFLVIFVLPVVIVVWLIKRLTRYRHAPAPASPPSEPTAA